ncbi:hypothetical protein ES708_31116 [subsurface metagenome]
MLFTLTVRTVSSIEYRVYSKENKKDNKNSEAIISK